MTDGRRRRCRSSDTRSEDGISLVEVLIALLILGVVMMALASTAVASLGSLARSEARQQAYTAATLVIEQIRDLDYSAVALQADSATSVVPFEQFDPVAGTMGTPGTGEPVVRLSDPAAVSPLEAAPFQQDDTVRVRTIVTLPDAGNVQQVRITVLAAIERGGSTEVVRQSTLVNSTERVEWGLEQPKFSATPVVGTLRTQQEPADPALRGPAGPDCVDRIDHRITNQGERDRYQLDTPNPAETPGFDVSAYEITDTGSAVLHAFGSYTAEYEVGESFRFRVCYRPSDEASSFTGAPFTVRSKLAEEAFASDPVRLEQLSQEILHNVEIDDERTLYLSGVGNVVRDPLVPYAFVTDPPTSAMPNYDLASDASPGLALTNAPGDDAAQTVVWRTTFDGRRTITQSPVLRIWTSSHGASVAPVGTAVPAETATLVIEVRKLAADGTLVGPLHASTAELTHATGGWAERVWSLDVDPRVWSQGEQLELALRCSPVSSAPCLLAFGGQEFPATLQLEFP